MTLLVAQVCDGNLIARTFLSEDTLQFTELGYLLTIDSSDDVAFLQACSFCSTVFNNLCHINTFHCSEVNLLVFLLFGIDIVLDVSTLDTDHCSLNVTILLEVINHLIHNGSRNCKTITDVRTCLRVKHGVDANQFTASVHQSTARVSLVDGSIGLDKTLNTIGTKRTSLSRDNTGRYRIVKSKGISNSKYPLADTHIVAVGDSNGWEILAVDLDESQVCGLIGTNDTG